MARYSKSASGEVKPAMKRRKSGTLRAAERQDRQKQKAANCDRTFRGSCERQEGSEHEVRVRAALWSDKFGRDLKVSLSPAHSGVVSSPRSGVQGIG